MDSSADKSRTRFRGKAKKKFRPNVPELSTTARRTASSDTSEVARWNPTIAFKHTCLMPNTSNWSEGFRSWAGPTYRKGEVRVGAGAGNRKKTTKNRKISTYTLFVLSRGMVAGGKKTPRPIRPRVLSADPPRTYKKERGNTTEGNLQRRTTSHDERDITPAKYTTKGLWARPSGPTWWTEPVRSTEAFCRNHAQKRKIHCS